MSSWLINVTYFSNVLRQYTHWSYTAEYCTTFSILVVACGGSSLVPSILSHKHVSRATKMNKFVWNMKESHSVWDDDGRREKEGCYYHEIYHQSITNQSGEKKEQQDIGQTAARRTCWRDGQRTEDGSPKMNHNRDNTTILRRHKEDIPPWSLRCVACNPNTSHREYCCL